MKITRWVVGIFALLFMELVLFLVLTIAFPEKTTAGGHQGGIQQSMVDQQMVDQQYEGESIADGSRGEGNDNEGNNVGEGSSDGGNNGGEGNRKGKSSRKGGKTERKIYKKHKEDLVLVNVEHAIEDSYDLSLRSICRGRLRASGRIYTSLSQMLSDAGEKGYHFWIASAYRSKERQQKLVDEDVAKAMRRGLSYRQALKETYRETMPAGHSEHQTGLALDILCSGNMAMDASQKAEPGNRWLRKNCCHYGFILRYPEEKSDITGVSFEPWHFRYVGREAAEYMEEEGITLEEFWDRMGVQ